MAVSSAECRTMIAAARENGVKLMIAYRLHFEAANLKAAEIAQSGKLGMLRAFNSVFSMQVREGNIRTQRELGGGPVPDIGIYCINAARSLFRSEPTEVLAMAARSTDPRFAEIDEAVAAILRYPGDRIATFVCSFGAADVSHYQIVGSKGNLRVDPAYEYEGSLAHHLSIGDKTRTRRFKPRDQFAPELLYFSDCILGNQEPEPGGIEGLKDVRIIEAIHESIHAGRSVPLGEWPADPPPQPSQELHRKPPKKRELVAVEAAHQ
jgi:glucose-fructose oxidoreductase